jgi:hypothetical protein
MKESREAVFFVHLVRDIISPEFSPAERKISHKGHKVHKAHKLTGDGVARGHTCQE